MRRIKNVLGGAKLHLVDTDTFLAEVAFQPVYPGVVGHTGVVPEDVFAHAHAAGSVPHGFLVSQVEAALFHALSFHIICPDIIVVVPVVPLVGLVGHAWLRGGRPQALRVFLKVTLEDWTQVEVFIPTRPNRAGGFHDFIPNCHEQVSRAVSAAHIRHRPIRGAISAHIFIHRMNFHPVNGDAARSKDLVEVIHLFVSFIHHLLGIHPPSADGVSTFGLVRVQAWFWSGYLSAFRTAQDYPLQWIPFVPGVYSLCHCLFSFQDWK